MLRPSSAILGLELLVPEYGPGAGGVGAVVLGHSHSLATQTEVKLSIGDLGGSHGFEPPDASELSSFSSLAGFSPALVRHLIAKKSSVWHQHGVWHPLSWATATAGRVRATPIVLTPHGMMEEWIVKRSPWKKRIAKLLYEQRLWKQVSVFHALTEKEVDDIRQTTLTKKPIFYIPNGLELSSVPEKMADRPSKTFLYMGRFHTKKGLGNLIDAWSKVTSVHPDYSLKIVGWGDDAEVAAAAHCDSISVLPAIFDEAEKARLLHQVDFLILPSFSEGLPMVVLEAWAQRTPVIMTRECNIPAGFEETAAIHIDPDADSILCGLKTAMALSGSQRVEMGNRGRRLVERTFSMSSVVEKLERTYRWVCGEQVDVTDIRFQ